MEIGAIARIPYSSNLGLQSPVHSKFAYVTKTLCVFHSVFRKRRTVSATRLTGGGWCERSWRCTCTSARGVDAVRGEPPRVVTLPCSSLLPSSAGMY